MPLDPVARLDGAGFATPAPTGCATTDTLAAPTAREPRRVPRGIEAHVRPSARGKFVFLGDHKLYVRGVTYGTFRPGADGHEYPSKEVVEQDFAAMAANGFNAVRTYTVPPRWLLDAALRHRLHVLVGLAIERYVGYLAERNVGPDVEEVVRAGVAGCAEHPAVLAYALANEIPAPIVRWHGSRRIERYLERLFQAAKDEEPDALVTYVNYPTTEYLQLPFLDLVCFNTYLESRDRFEAYLARLQNLAGERPLLLTEIGLDAVRNGEVTQAGTLDWQVRAAFASGCAGACVYAWTDEWHRGGADVEDWGFGLTHRDRSAKPALASVGQAFAEPILGDLRWPRISVVVCSYNGARTLRDCLEALERLVYPDYEVIVVNDGSQDATPRIAAEYGFGLISTENRGLSSARNTGMLAATGEIVAYIDDDAYPDVHWLTHLAISFMTTSHAAVGGPNISPPGAGSVAQCIANAPGNPTHVLLSDREAEHIPGCNMAIRKACLEAIGGFDVRFRTAGDDVDVCWRLREQGWTIGFSPGAMVWHRRRGSLGAFWKQQVGYGRAEAMLERKWPEKYNAAGHLSWSGRVYGRGTLYLFGWRSRIYYGPWGSAPFQSLADPAPMGLTALASTPEWYVIVLALLALSVLGELFTPLLFALPLLAMAVGLPVLQACASARRAWFPSAPRASRLRKLSMRCLTAFLCLFQPLARLRGRVGEGLTPWRLRGVVGLALPKPRVFKLWTERYQAQDARLRALDEALRAIGGVVRRGGSYDAWDLEVRGGMLGAGRLVMAVEEHGGGRQLVRLRAWPISSPGGLVLSFGLSILSCVAAAGGVGIVSLMLGAAALVFIARTIIECASAMGTTLAALARLGMGNPR